MKLPTTHDESDSLAEINITPLVDVMLVLLIIFMVTAPMLQQGIDISLPEVSAAGIDTKQDDFILSIDNLGRIYFNENSKENYALNSVEEKIKEVFAGRAKKELYLKADKDIKYNYVMQVMAACQRAGVERVGMITTSNDAEDQAPLKPQVQTKGKKRPN